MNSFKVLTKTNFLSENFLSKNFYSTFYTSKHLQVHKKHIILKQIHSESKIQNDCPFYLEYLQNICQQKYLGR